ncbi:hypothetical protein DI09_27p130 [Mitosporidium daphniae]|uniref:Putative lipoate-protein ligase A n=1 Tax=Mitosporidium daphniae TaxID=1485682 RepID=A0A098VSK1_9MICR|nr:uncharacterized protein DI09_27p130 [Mitosporidium daphniae]KGG51774.1 hypothetical protein DI09_27p130 [Mitosporidium daphniae]|eukprot:XP_013238201.1 uncharacterized protein DI09_27p130 [Mitosporidium daphniae]
MLNGLSTTGYRLEIKINFPKLFNLAKPPSLKRSLLLCRPYRSSSFLPSVGELADAISREKHICIRSLDPAPVFQHLALEEWILSFLEEAVDLNNEYRVLLFYVNKPCVVIGRNQLIWNECDPSIITTARRMSGGGAVYHDPGNLNFSLFTPKHLFRRERGIEALRTSLQAEIPASLLRTSTFHDLFLSEKKVSGSAFRIARGCAYHHGTALFCSDLQMLSKALKPKEFPDFFISSMGASKSRRSFVANINDHYPNLKVASIIDGMAKFLGILICLQFCARYPKLSFNWSQFCVASRLEVYENPAHATGMNKHCLMWLSSLLNGSSAIIPNLA